MGYKYIILYHDDYISTYFERNGYRTDERLSSSLLQVSIQRVSRVRTPHPAPGTDSGRRRAARSRLPGPHGAPRIHVSRLRVPLPGIPDAALPPRSSLTYSPDSEALRPSGFLSRIQPIARLRSLYGPALEQLAIERLFFVVAPNSRTAAMPPRVRK